MNKWMQAGTRVMALQQGDQQSFVDAGNIHHFVSL